MSTNTAVAADAAMADKGAKGGGGKNKNRKRIIRGLLLVLYVGLALLMVFSGRRHTVLIDNKGADDGSYKAVDGIGVSVDGGEVVEYYDGDRDKVVVQGQSHKIRIEVLADGTVTEKSFKVPLWEDMTILSVPKLLAGITPYSETFVSAIVTLPPEEESSGGFTSPDAVPEALPEAPPALAPIP